jgi:teichuronic acid biosynthesis glycosyltransferase TuaC
MKLLIVANYNTGKFSPFVLEQVEALRTEGVEVDFFGIVGKGFGGYLKNRGLLSNKIQSFKPDLIHAHYGLSGLLANLQRKVPVVTTYHGCDINKASLRILSVFAIVLSKFNIFVSQKQVRRVKLFLKRFDVIPCGIDYSLFYVSPKADARLTLGIDEAKKIVLFSSSFKRPEKNSTLAFEAMKQVPDAELVELDGYTREEVRLLMNACDVGLLTSTREGSPQFVKELLACNRPVVSTNVGDVEEIISGIKGCFIVPFEANEVAKSIKSSFEFDSVEVPKLILDNNDNVIIAGKLMRVYESVLLGK